MTAPAEEVPEVLTSREVAALTGYDNSTVCRWARSGALGDHVIRKTTGPQGTWLLRASVLSAVRKK